MKFKTKTVIEISERSIKVFQCLLSGKNPLSFGDILNIENLTDEGISEHLAGLRKAKNFSIDNSQIILVISRQHAILRYLDLPSQKIEELKAMVDLQAVNHIPYAREEVVVDFLPLDKNGEGYTKVFVAVVPKDVIMRFWNILHNIHMTPHKVTLSSIGLWQWYQTHWNSGNGVSVLMDVDSHRSEVCFCDRMKILTSRPTTVGIKEIETKQYSEFLKQLDWTMTSYVKEQLGPPMAQILILSSTDGLEEFKAEMQKEYNAPVHFLRTVQDVPLQKSFTWPNTLLQEGTSVTAVLGLLQSTEEIPIDLIPLEIKDSQSEEKQRHQLTRLGVIGAIALITIGFCLSLNYFKQNSYLSALEAKLKLSKKQVSLVEKKVQKVNALKGLLNNRIILMDIINEVYRLLPKGIVLTSINLGDGRGFSLQGFAKTSSDVNDMQRTLVDSPFFDNVNLDYVNKRIMQDGEVNYFKISCQIKAKGITHEKNK